MLQELVPIAAQYGAPTALFVGLLVFVLRENSKREERLVTVIKDDIGGIKTVLNNINTSLIAHDQAQNNYMADLKKANEYGRQEREGIVNTLAVLAEKISNIKAA